MTFWLNGDFREDKAAINIADRGFLLGDGVFETILLSDGTPVFLAAHIRRMRAGAAALGIEAQIDGAELAATITELSRRKSASSGKAWARVTVTRGAGLRGLAIEKGSCSPTLLITVNRYGAPIDHGSARVMVSSHRRNEHSITSRWKTLNYLDNVMAKEEATVAGVDDAIMMNSARRVACASAANVFLIREGTLKTPALEEGAMPGIVRGVVLEEAEKVGIKVETGAVAHRELLASSLFLTNSLIGLRAVVLKGARAADENATAMLDTLKSCYDAAMKADIEAFEADA